MERSDNLKHVGSVMLHDSQDGLNAAASSSSSSSSSTSARVRPLHKRSQSAASAPTKNKFKGRAKKGFFPFCFCVVECLSSSSSSLSFPSHHFLLVYVFLPFSLVHFSLKKKIQLNQCGTQLPLSRIILSTCLLLTWRLSTARTKMTKRRKKTHLLHLLHLHHPALLHSQHQHSQLPPLIPLNYIVVPRLAHPLQRVIVLLVPLL